MRRLCSVVRVLAVAGGLLASLQAAEAQEAGRCAAPQTQPSGNTVVSCPRLTIEIESGADFHLVGQGRSGSLTSGAVYVDDQSVMGRHPFQIRTPDAIASVRGTSWAVDVNGKLSSVFVVQGSVAVRRRLDGASVKLTAGEGVDVAPERAPLVVKHWSPERVAALLARLGR